ncbi:hypothetical protein [Anaeromyxobacter sp. PSR-1]|uniref:hypothetical protein n=1 Tax=unclassified Anaeromyxobacter TaxID=2620896 RepID=UPI0005E8733B|nr:hypothetical protein [Anaeromyxobacter sp. PSR-1]GAO02328.1 hypothetical protein PSR1_01199 [Anaeromyxobacter sp. PSR-1]
MTGLALPLTILALMVVSLAAVLVAGRRRRARSAVAPLPAGIRALASNVRTISGLGANLALPPARGSLRPTVTLTALR